MTITELEAELAELSAREKELWAKVSKLIDEHAKAAGEWNPVNQQCEKLRVRIQLLKEIESEGERTCGASCNCHKP